MLDVPALRQEVAERSKSRGKNEPPPQKRPPIAPELNKLPTFNVDIQFDIDTPIVRPESYQTLGRIADALVNSNAAALHIPDRRPYRIDRPARKQRPAQPATGRCDPRHPGQHLQDIVEAAAVGGTRRGTIARLRPSQRARQQSDADHDACENARAERAARRTRQKARHRPRRSRRKRDKHISARLIAKRPRVPISCGIPPLRLRRSGRSAALSFATFSNRTRHALMSPIISVSNLSKTYGSGFKALNGINLDIAAARSLRCSGRTAPARPR